MKLKVNKKVLFNEELHTYLLNGETILTGVTSLMRKHGLSPDYGGIDEEVLAQAARVGTLAHKTLESYDNGEPVVEGTLIKSYKRLGLKVLASEYLISDNKMVASSIDKVLATDDPCVVDLADVKRTSTVHKDALAWQLGIYKYLFELQNPKMKVRDCYCIHIIKGAKDNIEKDTIRQLIPITPVTAEEVEALFTAEQMGLIYTPEGKVTENAVAVLEEEMVSQYIATCSDIAALKAQIKALEDGIKGFEGQVYETMLERGLDEVEYNGVRIVLKRPYNRASVDTKMLQIKYPDIYRECLKETTTKGNISIK